jgi:WD40 repeat protein
VLLWDKFSAFSAGIDRSIRYFDIRDWGNENDSFNEDSETLNGYKFSKFFKGHSKSITNLKRLNNSVTRIVSSSEDSSTKIWDIYANQYCKNYSNSNIVGHKFDEKTEIVEPLISLEGDHQSGVKLIAINLCFLSSYSDQDNCLVLRDWEKP